MKSGRPKRISAPAAVTLAFLLSVPLFSFSPAPRAAYATEEQNYVILYRDNASTDDAASAVAAAGGTLVANYSQIGVVIARSSSDMFRSNVMANSRVENASSTAGFGVQIAGVERDAPGPDAPLLTPSSDNLSGLQWDMDQIHAPEAHSVTLGSSAVIVGDIDTGLDYTHPDLAPNVDFSRSVSCVSGAPDPSPAAWMDDNGHGTHTAGTIAAALNGVGIVGVAPGVKIAGIKAGNTDGYFFPEAVICSFVWAGTHQIDVTNNSYFADPWLFNCRNDPVQRAIWKAESRAIRFAMSRGVTVVAAEGNENLDLSQRNIDNISPDNGTPVPREVTNACVVIPVEIPGVIGVTGDGNLRQKSYYSSYGVGVADVVAPGGDRRFQITPAAPNGRVLSAYPAALAGGVPPSLKVLDCSVTPCAAYVYLQGTSMASPHAAGVAALFKSTHPNATQGAVSAAVSNTADPLPCPANPFLPGQFDAICRGGIGNNGFYGAGEVNALSATLAP
jgi:subtilisin family serine protease